MNDITDKMKYFGGVEGGATHSNLVICDQTGRVVGRSRGPGTNHWIMGIDECANKILEMVDAAKDDANIPRDQPLDCLGLTLSGCEQDSSNAELAKVVREKNAYSAKSIYVGSDTAGSLFTGAPGGGMVLIAGTGSNALLRTPDGQQYGCGGWGYMLGDEGGAYWIAYRALKMIFDECDGFRPAPHPTDKVWKAVKDYFPIETRGDLIPILYKNFEKSFFAGFTARLAILAEEGDAMSQHLFADAGAALMSHVAALVHKCQNGIKPFGNGLRIICVGSVWKSWDALRVGALKMLAKRQVNMNLELVRLRVSSAMGAAYLAAQHVGYDMPRDDSAFCEVFYTYTHKSCAHNGTENGYTVCCGCSDFWS